MVGCLYRSQELDNIQIFSELFLSSLIVKLTLAILNLAQRIVASTAKTPQVVTKYVLEGVLERASIHDHLV